MGFIFGANKLCAFALFFFHPDLLASFTLSPPSVLRRGERPLTTTCPCETTHLLAKKGETTRDNNDNLRHQEDNESFVNQSPRYTMASPFTPKEERATNIGTHPGWLRRKLPGLPWYQLPDALTYLRCFAIPVLAGLFYVPSRQIETGAVFALASFTDWLDGYLARRWKITSEFGAFLDPVADKLMVSTALILLAGRYGAVVAFPTAVILAREIAVSALREWMAQQGQRDTVKVGVQGKIKTAITMVSVTLLLLIPCQGSRTVVLDALHKTALTLLYMSSVITATSGIDYFRAAGPALLSSFSSDAPPNESQSQATDL